MTDTTSRTKKTYEVGYGKPPVASQFKKGQPSPNPSGRRSGKATEKRRAGSILHDVIAEPINITIDGKRVTMNGWEVVFRLLLKQATGGDLRAMKQLLAFAEKLGCLEPARQAMGGVLVVPAKSSPEEWAEIAAKQQAPYRCNTGDLPTDDDQGSGST